jgi:hypothetical protein
MKVARHLREMLFKVAGRVMTCRCQATKPQSSRPPLLRGRFRIHEKAAPSFAIPVHRRALAYALV